MSERFSAPANMKIDELIAAYDGILDQVEVILREKGISAEIPEPGMPEGLEHYLNYAENEDPVLPDDLTILGDVEIGKLFSLFTNWANYVQGFVSSAEASRDVIKAKVLALRTALTVTYQENDQTLSDKRAAAQVQLDPRFVQSEASYITSVALAKKLNTRWDQFKRSEKVISRELTRRAQELEALNNGSRRGPSDGDGGRGTGRSPWRPSR